jgi:hypothetical protein
MRFSTATLVIVLGALALHSPARSDEQMDQIRNALQKNICPGTDPDEYSLIDMNEQCGTCNGSNCDY